MKVFKETAFHLLNAPEYISLHQSQLEVSRFLHHRIYEFHKQFQRDHIHWNLKKRPGYWKFNNKICYIITNQIFPPVAFLHPYHKLHKSLQDWRRVTDFSNHPSIFYQRVLNYLLGAAYALLEKSTNYTMLLNNSFQLKLYLLDIKKNLRHEKKYEFIHRPADVSKLYRNITLHDAELGCTWILDLVNFHSDFIVGSIEIIRLVFETAFVAFKGKVCRLRRVMATGWVFSPLVANITVLYLNITIEMIIKCYYLVNIFHWLN